MLLGFGVTLIATTPNTSHSEEPKSAAQSLNFRSTPVCTSKQEFLSVYVPFVPILSEATECVRVNPLLAPLRHSQDISPMARSGGWSHSRCSVQSSSLLPPLMFSVFCLAILSPCLLSPLLYYDRHDGKVDGIVDSI